MVWEYDSPWMFVNPATGNPFWPSKIRENHLVPAGIAAGIGRVGWHTFRHTYSSLLREHEVDIKVQQALLRHADIRTTMNIYTQAIPRAVREANRKVVRNILGKQGGIEAAVRVPEASKSARALLRKSLKNQAAMISIPIARSKIPDDSIAFTPGSC
jgi:hypothetical protein